MRLALFLLRHIQYFVPRRVIAGPGDQIRQHAPDVSAEWKSGASGACARPPVSYATASPPRERAREKRRGKCINQFRASSSSFHERAPVRPHGTPAVRRFSPFVSTRSLFIFASLHSPPCHRSPAVCVTLAAFLTRCLLWTPFRRENVVFFLLFPLFFVHDSRESDVSRNNVLSRFLMRYVICMHGIRDL